MKIEIFWLKWALGYKVTKTINEPKRTKPKAMKSFTQNQFNPTLPSLYQVKYCSKITGQERVDCTTKMGCFSYNLFSSSPSCQVPVTGSFACQFKTTPYKQLPTLVCCSVLVSFPLTNMFCLLRVQLLHSWMPFWIFVFSV